MWPRLTCVVVMMAMAGAPAFAQAPGGVAPRAPAPAVAPKNPSTARALSFETTVGGALLLLLGGTTQSGPTSAIALGVMYLGPATGHWYAGESGGLGLGLRALAVAGAYAVWQASFWPFSMSRSDCTGLCSNPGLAEGLLLGSAALWIGSTIYDIATAPRAARSWNQRHHVAISPTAMRAANGGVAPGVALALRF